MPTDFGASYQFIFVLHLVPRSKNAWSYTSNTPSWLGTLLSTGTTRRLI